MTILGVLGSNEVILLTSLLIVLIPFIFFLITQQNTLKAIQPQHRTMPPGEVWLQIIPLFGFIWQFVVVTRIADSIKRELESENTFSFEQNRQSQAAYSNGSKPTYNIGLAYCILVCLGMIPTLGGLAAFAGLVCWIIYWVQLTGYKGRIEIRRQRANFRQDVS